MDERDSVGIMPTISGTWKTSSSASPGSWPYSGGADGISTPLSTTSVGAERFRRDDGDSAGDAAMAIGTKEFVSLVRTAVATQHGGTDQCAASPIATSVMAAVLVVSAAALYTAAALSRVPWGSGECEAQYGLAALVGVLLVACDRPRLRVLGAVVGACHVIVCAVAAGVGLAGVDGALGAISVVAALAHAIAGGALFVFSIARSWPCRVGIGTASRERTCDGALVRLVDAWAIIHSVILFVVVASVARMRRSPFAAFVAVTMPLPVATVATWRSSRNRRGPCAVWLSVALAVATAAAVGGMFAYGIVIFIVDAVAGKYGSIWSMEFALPMVRGLMALWTHFVLCAPYILVPFVPDLGSRLIAMRVVTSFL